MTDWQARLSDGDLVLLDGGTGSELRRRGVALHPLAWTAPSNLTHPGLLRDIHLDYIAAGADIVTTNTFATSRFVLAAAGLGHEFARVNGGALDAALGARSKAGRPVAVAGAMSCLPPRFDVRAYPEPGRERAAYAELARFLAEGGADLLLLEMMEDTVHAQWALEAACATGLPVVLGLSLRPGPGPADDFVAFDFPEVSLGALARALLPMSPALVAVMHTPCAATAPALAALRAYWSGPLGAYPLLNGAEAVGRGEDSGGVSPAEFVGAARRWVALGARLLGGCCGSTPAHIRALDEARSSLRAPPDDQMPPAD